MTTKSKAAARPHRSPDAISSLSVESDERYQDEVDAFIGRNRETLNESIERSREELRNGIVSNRTIDDIIADGRRRFSKGR